MEYLKVELVIVYEKEESREGGRHTDGMSIDCTLEAVAWAVVWNFGAGVWAELDGDVFVLFWDDAVGGEAAVAGEGDGLLKKSSDSDIRSQRHKRKLISERSILWQECPIGNNHGSLWASDSLNLQGVGVELSRQLQLRHLPLIRAQDKPILTCNLIHLSPQRADMRMRMRQLMLSAQRQSIRSTLPRGIRHLLLDLLLRLPIDIRTRLIRRSSAVERIRALWRELVEASAENVVWA